MVCGATVCSGVLKREMVMLSHVSDAHAMSSVAARREFIAMPTAAVAQRL